MNDAGSPAALVPLRKRDRARAGRREVVFRAIDGDLFAETPRPTDALQGVIGDCYCLSAFSALAHARPELLRQLLTSNGDGTYSARFHRRTDDGPRAESVTFDGSVPVRAADGRPIYARSRRSANGRDELWPLLAEKGYAVWKGGYDVIGEGGLVEQTLEELTGGRTRMLLVGETHPEELWGVLERATLERWPTVVCTQGRRERPGIDELGFHPNHIVIFLGVHTWLGKRIVWLRDPFDVPACGELALPDPSGVYTVAWDDFLGYFAEVEVNAPDALAVTLSPHPSIPISESLARSYAFGALTARARRACAKDFSRRVAAPGEVIARAGTAPEHLHLIEHGSAAVELPSKRGRSRRLGVARAGELFGEAHVLDGRLYDASLVALTEVAHYRISRDKLLGWLRDWPELEARLRRRWDLRLTMLEWSSRQLTTLDADALLHASAERRCARGEAVYAIGDAARSVYLVLEGSVEILTPRRRGGLKRSSVVRAGGVFGEGEVLRRRLRETAARACARTLLLEIDLGDSAEVVDRFDIVQRQLVALAERRQRFQQGQARHEERTQELRRAGRD